MGANRGLFLWNILLSAVSLPAIMLLSGRLVDGILFQLIGFGIVTIFVFIFPKLKDFKNTYLLAQVIGWVCGMLVFISAVSSEMVVVVWVVLMVILFFSPSIKAYHMLQGSKQLP